MGHILQNRENGFQKVLIIQKYDLFQLITFAFTFQTIIVPLFHISNLRNMCTPKIEHV